MRRGQPDPAAVPTEAALHVDWPTAFLGLSLAQLGR